MPLEIRELQIKVNVGGEAQAENETAANSGGNNLDETQVKALVDQVLAALKEQRER